MECKIYIKGKEAVYKYTMVYPLSANVVVSGEEEEALVAGPSCHPLRGQMTAVMKYGNITHQFSQSCFPRDAHGFDLIT